VCQVHLVTGMSFHSILNVTVDIVVSYGHD
jgi:hypothetical protein